MILDENKMTKLFLCQNKKLSQAVVTETIRHELVHMFDLCRAHVHSCQDMACMEVRASMLSGECLFGRELDRSTVSYLTWSGHFPKCVRRRALYSLQFNSRCPDSATVCCCFNSQRVCVCVCARVSPR